MDKVDSIIWLILTIMFLVMSGGEWKKSKRNLKSLEKIQTDSSGAIVQILGVDFSKMLETMKSELNKSNQESHSIAFLSYLLAGVTALASFTLSIL